MSEKPVENPVAATMPGRNGGTLKRGGTIKPGPGRPPDEFKKRMASLATWTDKAGFLLEVLGRTDHPHWMKALEYVTERGYGKVPQAVDLNGKIETVTRFTLDIGERDSDG